MKDNTMNTNELIRLLLIACLVEMTAEVWEVACIQDKYSVQWFTKNGDWKHATRCIDPPEEVNFEFAYNEAITISHSYKREKDRYGQKG